VVLDPLLCCYRFNWIHIEICAILDESLILVHGLAMLVLYNLLVPVRIPPSELSDTCKPSHCEIEINKIDLIEP